MEKIDVEQFYGKTVVVETGHHRRYLGRVENFAGGAHAEGTPPPARIRLEPVRKAPAGYINGGPGTGILDVKEIVSITEFDET
jgi:hypothetical protein